LTDGKLNEVGRSTLDNGLVVPSQGVPLAFQLLPGQKQPKIEVTHGSSGQRWVV
jgi:hypothetical protein